MDWKIHYKLMFFLSANHSEESRFLFEERRNQIRLVAIAERQKIKRDTCSNLQCYPLPCVIVSMFDYDSTFSDIKISLEPTTEKLCTHSTTATRICTWDSENSALDMSRYCIWTTATSTFQKSFLSASSNTTSCDVIFVHRSIHTIA